MKRVDRLRRTSDFERVRRHGKSYTHPLLVLLALENDLPTCRMGIVVSKGVGTAVVRNRLKRQMRASLAAKPQACPNGFDLVWIMRRGAAEEAFQVLDGAVSQLLHKLHQQSLKMDKSDE